MPGTRDRGPDFSSGILDAEVHMRLDGLRRASERELRYRRLEREANERNMAQAPRSPERAPHSTDRESAKPGCDGQPAVRPT